ncbi:MAG: hypothetical protein SGPRY_010764, partial [Prymnesium sp.]
MYKLAHVHVDPTGLSHSQHLTKRLKPLETSAASEGEFRDLCYLLTCKSVQEVLRDWEGVDSLIEDYSCPLLPNATHAVLKGHKAAVKCITWLSDGRLASGCNDGTLRLWDASDQTCTNVLEGHTGRVWDVSSNGEHIVSASADGTVRLWRSSADEMPDGAQ